MNILVTGGAGYVGSVLIPKLIEDGHHIKCLDRFFFGKEFFEENFPASNLELIQDDIRWFKPEILQNIDTVMDLAALSNDPVGELDPQKTFEINHLGRARVCKLSKEMGVSQYILASSASIYGQQDGIADETSEVHPLTSYSKANRKAEIDVLDMSDNNFTVTVLRFSSVYGTSPRMRFDISVNSMVLELFKKQKIVVRGKSNRRPFIHILDAVKAYLMFLNAKPDLINGEIFNVGSDEQNFQIGDLAKEIVKSIGIQCDLELGDTQDHRSYTTSFKKINEKIGYSTEHSLKQGVKEIFEDLKSNKISDNLKTITLEWYKEIQTNSKLREQFLLNEKIL